MVGGVLVAALFLHVLEYFTGLIRRDISPHPHVHHQRLPLARRPFPRISFRVAPAAIDRVKILPAQLLRLRRIAGARVSLLLRFSISACTMSGMG